MRNTWWVTRPKRMLSSVPMCLLVLSNAAEGKVWTTQGKKIELEYERNLELAGLKAVGKRRDQGGGGARTYRAWLKSLGLVFMDDENRLQLTSAGAGLVQGEPPLEILTKQVLGYQFPSAFSYQRYSAVDPRFRVRPFIFLLQLLLDPRLGGYLIEKEDIAKIALCYGENNSQRCVDDVVERILEHREKGDACLPAEYLHQFQSTRSREASLDKLFNNLADIANTMANWLGYTQIVSVEKGPSVWRLAAGSKHEVQALVDEWLQRDLIKDPDDEELFQRRYGLKPGQRKDTRNLGGGPSVTSTIIEEREIDIAFMRIASTRIVDSIDQDTVNEVATVTGFQPETVERVLVRKYPTGSVNQFMNNYAQLSFQSREKATEFEQATTSIFRDVFGFQTQHIGQQARRPDIVIASDEAHYGAILDSKAYKDGYSAGIAQQNRMRDYIEDFGQYSLTQDGLAFFAYVVSEYKLTINSQIRDIAQLNGVPGSAIAARNIIRMVERHQTTPYSHEEIRNIFTVNRGITPEDLDLCVG